MRPHTHTQRLLYWIGYNRETSHFINSSKPQQVLGRLFPQDGALSYGPRHDTQHAHNLFKV
jgi:hypothetical protein